MLIQPKSDFTRHTEHGGRIKVGVLVDLPHTSQAGGHIRAWERIAEAARHFPDQIDLTVHFSGPERDIRPVADNVRFAIEPPVFSTARLPFLSHVPDHTDLARRHRRLEKTLAGYDVIHTTDAYFAYARSAIHVTKALGIPVVNSVHTNTPEYARIFTAQTIERLIGRNRLSRLLIDDLGIARGVEARMNKRLDDHQRHCSAVLVSRPDQLRPALERTGGRAALLQRGLDLDFFSPAQENRALVDAAFRIPPDRVLILYAGRVNRGKNVMLLVDAMQELLDRGLPVHLICAGQGDDRAVVQEALGDNASCPGYLDPEALARLYASADIFAFPSKVEECANVVLEALASGLPVLVTREAGMGRFVSEGRTGFILPGDRTEAWIKTIEMLAYDHDRRAAMGLAARDYAERKIPSWKDILTGTLLPLWRRAAAEAVAE